MSTIKQDAEYEVFTHFAIGAVSQDQETALRGATLNAATYDSNSIKVASQTVAAADVKDDVLRFIDNFTVQNHPLRPGGGRVIVNYPGAVDFSATIEYKVRNLSANAALQSVGGPYLLYVERDGLELCFLANFFDNQRIDTQNMIVINSVLARNAGRKQPEWVIHA